MGDAPATAVGLHLRAVAAAVPMNVSELVLLGDMIVSGRLPPAALALGWAGGGPPCFPVRSDLSSSVESTVPVPAANILVAGGVGEARWAGGACSQGHTNYGCWVMSAE
jgi:hypothetical protein